jgi:type IV pilus assembly protein PilA
MINNKGVTLVELLIVIVVLGIISAFAVPAVGNIIENTRKDSIHADALAIHSATRFYCAQNTCEEGQDLTFNEVIPYIDGFDEDYYELDYETGVFGEDVVSKYYSNTIIVSLWSKIVGSYDWLGADPTVNDRDFVTVYE